MVIFCILLIVVGVVIAMTGLFNQTNDAILVGVLAFVLGIILFAVYIFNAIYYII